MAQNSGFKYLYYVDAYSSLLNVGASGRDHTFPLAPPAPGCPVLSIYKMFGLLVLGPSIVRRDLLAHCNYGAALARE